MTLGIILNEPYKTHFESFRNMGGRQRMTEIERQCLQELVPSERELFQTSTHYSCPSSQDTCTTKHQQKQKQKQNGRQCRP